MLTVSNIYVQYGDRILLDMIDVPDEMTVELIRAARVRGAVPFVETRHTRVGREMLRGIDEKHAATVRDMELFRMKKMQAYIAIRGSENASVAPTGLDSGQSSLTRCAPTSRESRQQRP